MLYGNNYGLSVSPFGAEQPPPAPPPLIPHERQRLQGLPSLRGFGQTDEVTAGVQTAIAKGKVKQIAVVDTKPATILVMSFSQFKKEFLKAWYAKWWVWAIAGSVVAAGGGTYLYMRRRR